MKRSCGLLAPVFSLPGKYGIGTFGKESYEFVDFLAGAGQSVWQLLPLGQTSFGDSPYQTTSDGSLNPYFCDLDDLHEKGLITDGELKSAALRPGRIDYGKLYKTRFALLKKAFARYSFPDEFLAAANSGKYDGYALFMALKDIYGDLSRFPADLKTRDKRAIAKFKEERREEYLFYVFLQFVLDGQYSDLKKYAAERGVKILGDLPLYVAYDSADVWLSPRQFLLGDDLTATDVAGVPPDYFSADGQLWGNPLYDYDKMRADGFRWWKRRLKSALKRYDMLRIDHFRGLDRFWAIPYGRGARDGRWLPSPGRDFLKTGDKRIIAEDLGMIDDGVRDLLAFTGYPGMKVLLFAFDGNPDNPYLPANIGENSVVYVGTHDNDTAYGYARTLSDGEFGKFKDRVNAALPDGIKKVRVKKDVAPALVEAAYSSKAKLAIVTPADALGLGNEYRTNTPATVGNWTARYKPGQFDERLKDYLLALAKKYKRI